MYSNSMNKNIFVSVLILVVICSTLPAQELPTATSNLFSGSGICALCHVSNSGVFLTHDGKDISPVTLWRSTMMANSSKDPLWQAKVTTEVVEHPALQAVIEDKCTTCHTPMGRTEAIYNASDNFTFAQGMADTLSLDGVSCTLCHQIQSQNLGEETSFSGHYPITDAHQIFGPYISPTSAPMLNQTGYLPVFSEHINHSGLCATCHTLFTPYVDNGGQVAGYFPEQTPYLEWENSIYPNESIECQTCHMPEVNEAMKIAIQPPWLTTLRKPVWAHEFVGGNVFMNTLLKINSTEIGVIATAIHFDSTISSTRRMLQEQTVNLSATASIVADTLRLNILIENLAGHKFPTGFPSRRAWIYVLVKNNSNEIIFESGKWDENGEILGEDDTFEPHYDIITESNQVQIYQPIMTDIDNLVTTTLLRAAHYVKDNRLPPKGFTSAADGYESISISGAAIDDQNFNRDENGNEGTGSDRLQYRIPVAGKGEQFQVLVEIYYQSLSPQFASDLFLHTTEKVNAFKGYYDSADKSPVLLRSAAVGVTNSSVRAEHEILRDYKLLKNYPNPFNASTSIQFMLPDAASVSLKIFDIRGKVIQNLISQKAIQAGFHTVQWNGTQENGKPVSSGLYFCVLESNGERLVNQMILLK
ncbi:T9SS type A sorting domain-containing protein [candidate division KSB1 bacterium]|nr:T9SS type A sorting domain-containing protein [candidate division KSB1 bacterium]